MTKICTKCTLPKPLMEFYKNSRYADGYVTWCRDCKKEHARKNPQHSVNWRKDNPERSKAIKDKYVAENLDQVRISKAKWSKANSKKVLAKTRKYQADKLQATPSWLSKEHVEKMVTIYVNCPEGYEVDHIVPLRGKLVRGLHVPWNLKYLTVLENRHKSNKY